jgi:integrase
MPITRTKGISIAKDGSRTLNKVHRGQRIFIRLGKVSQEEAERKLAEAIQKIEAKQFRRANTRPVWAECAARYLIESTSKRSVETIAWHIRLLLPYIGQLQVCHIHDDTLYSFKESRLEEGVSPTTVNRSLEVVRTTLIRAARAWRDEYGNPWLSTEPPLITMVKESRRKPRPISWDEQDRLFAELPEHLKPMVLFTINTGLRDNNVCGLRWAWERPIPEIERSVFIIPPEEYKTAVGHVVILNDEAWRIVESQRGKDEVFVFAFRGHRIDSMNNNGWQHARSRAELEDVRIHDLRHTYASRLRLSGVSQEDRNALMGHKSASIPEHYASADIGVLIERSNRVLDRKGTRTLLSIINTTK